MNESTKYAIAVAVPVAAAVAFLTARFSSPGIVGADRGGADALAARVEGLERAAERIEAAATAAFAPRLVRAIETRILDGSLDAETRSRAGMAVAVASLRAPEIGVAVLRRLAEAETDPVIAEHSRSAAAALQEGNATLKSLERLVGE
jgi:hypothetical protein